MNNLIKTLIFIAAAALLVGCLEDNMHTNGYYSSAENSVDEMTTGYNRDYQKPKKGYQSSNSSSSRKRITPTRNGYGSSNQDDGTASVENTSGYRNNGYGSSS